MSNGGVCSAVVVSGVYSTLQLAAFQGGLNKITIKVGTFCLSWTWLLSCCSRRSCFPSWTCTALRIPSEQNRVTSKQVGLFHSSLKLYTESLDLGSWPPLWWGPERRHLEGSPIGAFPWRASPRKRLGYVPSALVPSAWRPQVLQWGQAPPFIG